MENSGNTPDKKTKKPARSTKAAKAEGTSSEETKKPAAKKSASGAAKSKAEKAEKDSVTQATEPEPEKPRTKAAAAAASAEIPAEKKEPEKEEPETPKDADVTDNTVLPSTRGKVGLFGGPKDRSIKPDDKLALPIGRHFTYERARSLNWKSFYCAMRWNYRLAHMSPEEGKRWWANKKLTVTNAANGKSVVVRAVDYGPHENSGLDILISPGAAEAIEVEAGVEVEIAFADQKAPLGPVE